MPTIPYSATSFPKHMGSRLQPGPKAVAVGWPEIVRHAITVGRAGWGDVFKHGAYSVNEMWYRQFLVAANLMEASSGALMRPPAYDDLDPSEKGAVSYFLGLTMAKLFNEQLFRVRWLQHLDKYKALVPKLWKGRSRPDLVGADSSQNWVAVEAKGRTNRADKNLLPNAKKQLQNLKMVAGESPSLRVASALHFDNGFAEVLLADPYEINPDAVDLRIAPDQFIRDYYAGIIDLVHYLPSQEVQIDGTTYLVAHLPDGAAEVAVGLDVRVLRLLDQDIGGREFIGQLIAVLPHTGNPMDLDHEGPHFDWSRDEPDEPDTTTSRGLDGVVVRVGPSWSADRMCLAPQERRQ